MEAGGSLNALPIVETESQNIYAYMQKQETGNQ
jgi:F0F1-type ATP synthase alpha subunit